MNSVHANIARLETEHQEKLERFRLKMQQQRDENSRIM